MPILLYRVDERLIHGQVVVGWGHALHPDRIVVVDDELASSGWEQELYALGLPAEIVAEFDTVEQARSRLTNWREGSERVLLLTRDVRTMRRLAAEGRLRGQEINLGGIHYAPGREAVLPYLYLSDAERRDVARLGEEGTRVSARDLPGARRVDLREIMDGKGKDAP